MHTPASRPHPSNRLLAAAFLLIIVLPLVGNLAGLDGADAYEEHRELAVRPPVGLVAQHPIAYLMGLSAWFEDHFAFRSLLVRWYGESRLFGLRQSPTQTVGLGRDGWLFYLDDRALEDFTRETPLSASDVAGWRDIVTTDYRWLKDRGIGFVFTVAPDKHVLYPEEFPPSVHSVRSESRADQLFQTLRDTAVTAVDVRPALRAAKARDRLYYKTDTHWNARGAFVAYQTIIDAARAQNPRIPPAWNRTDFTDGAHTIDGLDLAGMIGLRRVLKEENLTLTPRRPRQARVVEPEGAAMTDEIGRLVTGIPGSTLPRAVIFRDSFTSELVPFLSEHFSRAVYLWESDLNRDVIDAEHPDVVIHEIVGRYIWSFSDPSH